MQDIKDITKDAIERIKTATVEEFEQMCNHFGHTPIRKSCSNCKNLDEYFGDCCAPQKNKPLDFVESSEQCTDKDWAWWISK